MQKPVAGGAIAIGATSWLKTNNVTFENNQAGGGAVYVTGHYTSVNDKFINNQAKALRAISGQPPPGRCWLAVQQGWRPPRVQPCVRPLHIPEGRAGPPPQ